MNGIQKGSLSALVAIVALWSASSSHAQLRFSLSAGPNFTTLDVDLENIRNPEYDAVVGFFVSVNAGLTLGPLSVHSGANYVNAGAIFNGSEFLSRDEFDVNFITVPLDVRVYLPITPIATPYILGGAELRYLLDLSDADAEFEEALNRQSTAASIGLGVKLKVPGIGISLAPEVRYHIDVTGLTEGDVDLRDEVLRIRDEFKADMLRLGLVVGL